MNSPASVPASTVETRRERQRRELVAEILTIARRQLEAGGAGAVSWRGIAREVGMNPASLYTYFANLDELYTALLLDSFESLAAATRAAADEVLAKRGVDRVERIVAVARGYRRWALQHPHQYNLLFTDLIPGYEAPADGPTVAGEQAVFAPFAEVIVADGVDDEDDDLAGADEGGLPVPALHIVRLLGVLHGQIGLEINNHLDWLDTDLDAAFDINVRHAVGAVG